MARTKRKRRPNATGGLADHEPLRHQQQHQDKPFVPETVKIRTSVGKVNGVTAYVDEDVVKTVRRQADAQIWARLEEDHDRAKALNQVVGAWRSITSGVGMRTFDPTRVSGPGDAAASATFNYDLRRTYVEWVALAKDREIEHRVVTDLFCHLISARTLDAHAKRRKGWALDEMDRALDLWCEIRGWKKKARAA